MKALILAAGRGRRLGRISRGLNKCMLNLREKPLLEYSLDCAWGLEEIKEIVVVVGYKANNIMKRYGRAYKGKKIKYVKQEERKGLVHAIECAKAAVGPSDFMLMLGDELMIRPRHKEFIKNFKLKKVFALCGMVHVSAKDLVKKTYTVIQSKDKKIFRLIEKPNYIFNDLMGTGNCIFNNKIFDYIPKTPINQNRHEKELPDLIQCAIDDGRIVKSFIICDRYVNVNSKEEMKRTESYFAHI